MVAAGLNLRRAAAHPPLQNDASHPSSSIDLPHRPLLPYTPPMNITAPYIQPILAAIQAAGGRPLIVGGAVRDALMGAEVNEFDIEVYDLPIDQLSELLVGFGRVDAVGRSFGILKLRTPTGHELDIALPRRESKIGAGHRGFLAAPDPTMTPREAAARRDFTWNALAITPEGQLLDFFGGAADLSAGIIRHTTAAFAEDPLRVLRAMQFAARFDMRLAPATAALCRTLLPEAATLATERIWGEWQKWARQGRKPAAGLRVLAETGWLTLYPELEKLIGCPQDSAWHPEGDVWIHTLHVVDAAAEIAEREQLGDDQRALLLFAALCHDLGKPATTTIGANGRIGSPKHAQAGVEPTAALLRRIGCPRALIAQVAPLVREHMAHIGMQVSDRTVRRLALRLTPATITQWGRLVEADHSGRPPLLPSNPGAEIVALAEQLNVSTGRPTPILQGRDLLAIGMPPGPALGAALERAYHAQIDGAFDSIEAGLAWVARAAANTTD
jgi:tRNA nucleotidyltransferase (CCA-adding enzyme)